MNRLRIALFPVLSLIPVVCLAIVILRKLGLARPAEPAKLQETPADRAEADLSAGLIMLCGVGFLSSAAGYSLVQIAQKAALETSAAQLKRYWLSKLAVVTLVFGLALVSTTAIEAIVLLPLYRGKLARSGEKVDDGSLEPFFRALGTLFRINAVAVSAVLLALALVTLPTRLASPGFLF
ncbi:MAG: hypothetical protein HY815_28670 [Candidatus Riflebacteria bacterium]|nr:hypothetical protein [Candidatus Riflebacteria bacterium]